MQAESRPNSMEIMPPGTAGVHIGKDVSQADTLNHMIVGSHSIPIA